MVVLRPSVEAQDGASSGRLGIKTRAFISAQEGCNDVCAFCIIPSTRGRERSKPVEAVVAEALAREAEGVQEIVITGTQLGAYGRDWGYRTPYQLIKALVEETSVPRIRMSSVQPQDLSDELIDLWRSRVCAATSTSRCRAAARRPCSACAAATARTSSDDAVQGLREAMPGIAITTDVIVGFPGETDAEFEESFEFCREMAFAAIHVFPYSQRSGTVAFKLPDQVPDADRRKRACTG